MLKDPLESYLAFDSSSSCCYSLSASLVPQTNFDIFELEPPSHRHLSNDLIVYSRRKTNGKEKMVDDNFLPPLNLHKHGRGLFDVGDLE